MSEDQVQDESGNAIKTSVSLPPYLHEWLNEVVKSKKFNSKSGAVVVALSEMKGRLEARENKSETEQVKISNSTENNLIYAGLMLIANHKELIGEWNELVKTHPPDLEHMKKVRFE